LASDGALDTTRDASQNEQQGKRQDAKAERARGRLGKEERRESRGPSLVGIAGPHIAVGHHGVDSVEKTKARGRVVAEGPEGLEKKVGSFFVCQAIQPPPVGHARTRTCSAKRPRWGKGPAAKLTRQVFDRVAPAAEIIAASEMCVTRPVQWCKTPGKPHKWEKKTGGGGWRHQVVKKVTEGAPFPDWVGGAGWRPKTSRGI